MSKRKATQTSIRMTSQTRDKIKALKREGHSSTATGIIEIAIDRMYREELIQGRVQPLENPKSGWELLTN